MFVNVYVKFQVFAVEIISYVVVGKFVSYIFTTSSQFQISFNLMM